MPARLLRPCAAQRRRGALSAAAAAAPAQMSRAARLWHDSSTPKVSPASADLVQRALASGGTMVGPPRLLHLASWCERLRGRGCSFVECGVARGGSLGVMAGCTAENDIVWGFDSFQPMPALTAEDEGDGEHSVGMDCSGGRGSVDTTFATMGLPRPAGRVRVVEGWFQDTLRPLQSSGALGPIALLRLDCDWFAATSLCLEVLYPAMMPGGVVLVDDYGTFHGCRKAVDDFRRTAAVRSPLLPTPGDSDEFFWVKDPV
eukprot:TRINITY_DN42358_c0_g1_i1.p1 TRINITY_DN42358_c0_g1~~TRINITY_DN42358_c0_g1_i1.p1  ORF type:complete len:281 (+),score=47.11 TRINITY_DN42358_c0_g1_i1:69-845(+)